MVKCKVGVTDSYGITSRWCWAVMNDSVNLAVLRILIITIIQSHTSFVLISELN